MGNTNTTNTTDREKELKQELSAMRKVSNLIENLPDETQASVLRFTLAKVEKRIADANATKGSA